MAKKTTGTPARRRGVNSRTKTARPASTRTTKKASARAAARGASKAAPKKKIVKPAAKAKPAAKPAPKPKVAAKKVVKKAAAKRPASAKAAPKTAAPKKRVAPKKVVAPKKAAVARKSVPKAPVKAAAPSPAPAKAVRPKRFSPKPRAAAAPAPAETDETDGTGPAGGDSSLGPSVQGKRPQAIEDDLETALSAPPGSADAIRAGDVDVNLNTAYSSGDEAPGGDNPTPDQDVVDLIGRSLGVEYEDDEELRGADKIADRDRHRWELDPASAEDFKDRTK